MEHPRSTRQRLLQEVFKTEALTEDQLSAVNRLLDHLSEKGTLPLPDVKDPRKAFLEILDKASRECFGLPMKSFMTSSRNTYSVLYRAICWERYKDAFPVDSFSDIRQAFRCRQSRYSIRYAILRLPDQLQYDKRAAAIYKNFRQTVDILVYRESQNINP